MAGLEYLTTATASGGTTRVLSLDVSSYTDYKDLLILGSVSAGNGLSNASGAYNTTYNMYSTLNDPSNARSGTPYAYQYMWVAQPTLATTWASYNSDQYNQAHVWMGYVGHQWHNPSSATYDGPQKYGATFLRFKLPSFQTGRPLMTWELGMKGQWSQSGGSQIVKGAMWKETVTGVSSVQISTADTSWEFQNGSYLSVYGLNE